MPSSQERRFPGWAEEERADDLAWINENWHIFWAASQVGYERWGRGALVIDTTTVIIHEAGAGSPLSYVPQEATEARNWEELDRLLREYDPSWEIVAVLLKERGRKSAYRLGMAEQRPSKT